MDRLTVAAVFMGLSALVATTDGLYFHLYKYRLFARPESLTEHVTHTIRAVLFGPIVFLLFGRGFAGAALWGTLALVVADFAVQSWDVLVEKESRASLGGLSSIEYWLHVLAVTTHVAAVTLVLADKPSAAWSLSAPLIAPVAWPAIASTTALLLVPGAVGVAGLHLWLLQPKYRARAAAAAG